MYIQRMYRIIIGNELPRSSKSLNGRKEGGIAKLFIFATVFDEAL